MYARLKRPPQDMFGEGASAMPNHLRFRLEPEVVIALGVRAKIPGERMVGESIELDARHQHSDDTPPYARLLGDAMEGDRTNFTREDGVMAAWEVVEPILGDVVPVHSYEQGTWGPPAADQLVSDGWYDPRAKEPKERPY